jgi:hypothetical protein
VRRRLPVLGGELGDLHRRRGIRVRELRIGWR